MKNEKIITHVEIPVKPELIGEVLIKAAATRDIILQEDGCEAFSLTTKKEDPNTLIIYGIYKSRETYEWHLDQDYIKTFFGYLNDKLLAPPKVTYLEEV